MGQCCAKCKDRQEEDATRETRPENDRTSITPLVPSPESPVSLPEAEAPQVPQQDESPSASKAPIRESPPVSPVAPDVPASPKSHPMENYLNYPILQDKETMEYVQKSKVMVILKGLPGAGKSYIASKLKQTYKDAATCSADLYFMKDGEYKYNVEELKFAHGACQESAKKAAIKGAPVIIIDNTNLQAWNYKYYLKLSKEHHYTPLIMEPKTPWSKNTKELSKRNSHGVPKETLDQKLKKYEPPLPLFYWWFLNEEDSALILTTAQDWLKKSLQVQEFFKDFCEFSEVSSVEDMMRYYRKNEGQGDYKILHATASVTRKGKAKNAREYMAKKVVRESLGKRFTLRIIGFVLTPRTFGIRLKLGEEALEVWGMDDNEEEPEDTLTNAGGRQPSAKQGEQVSLGNTALRKGSCGSTLRTGDSQLHGARFHPTSGVGSRAHLTLGCAPLVHAKITGFDLMKVVSCEQRLVKSEDPGQSGVMCETFSIPDGELRTYGDGIWVIYPEKELLVSSLFSAFY